jgi:hypothetical protein
MSEPVPKPESAWDRINVPKFVCLMILMPPCVFLLWASVGFIVIYFFDLMPRGFLRG